MGFHASVITLYPEMFPGPLGISLAGRALDKKLWAMEVVALREFGVGPHKQVDDTPSGGGAGMVLKPDVLVNAIDSVVSTDDKRPKLVMSPRGRVLDQKFVRELANGPGVVIVSGRFEGLDERAIVTRNLTEVSMGDYVLSGGEIAAMALLDAVVRLLPGVMGNENSGLYESHENGLLEHPHYTRPQLFEDHAIPSVLVSGNHKLVAKWRHEKALEITQSNRPDMLKAYNEKESR